MDFTYDKRLGGQIRTLRERQNWTQEQLAARLQTSGCDITRSALAKIEVGQRHLYAGEIKAIKEIFGIRHMPIAP